MIGWPFWLVLGSLATVLAVAAVCFLVWLHHERRLDAELDAAGTPVLIRSRHRRNTAVATAAANVTSAIH